LAKRTYGTGSMTQYSLPDGTPRFRARWWHVADPRTGESQQRSRSFATRDEAEAFLQAQLRGRDRSTVMRRGRTIARLMEHWLADEIAVRVKPTTLQHYQMTVRTHVIPRIGHQLLQDFSKADVVSFRAALVRECGSRTAQQAFDRLAAALRWAVEMEWIEKDPSLGVKRPKSHAQRATPLTDDQSRAFLALTAHDEYRPLWQVFLATGLRRGEALGLRWCDLDLEHGRLSVRQEVVRAGSPPRPLIQTPKTKASWRTIPIDAQLVAELTRHRDTQQHRREQSALWHDDDLVFCKDNGRPLCPDLIKRRFDKIRDALAIPTATIHALRHTHASQLLLDGVPVLEVAHRLGHRNSSVTLDTYGHLLPGFQGNAVRSVEATLYHEAPSQPDVGGPTRSVSPGLALRASDV
jgi:integrase